MLKFSCYLWVHLCSCTHLPSPGMLRGCVFQINMLIHEGAEFLLLLFNKCISLPPGFICACTAIGTFFCVCSLFRSLLQGAGNGIWLALMRQSLCLAGTQTWRIKSVGQLVSIPLTRSPDDPFCAALKKQYLETGFIALCPKLSWEKGKKQEEQLSGWSCNFFCTIRRKGNIFSSQPAESIPEKPSLPCTDIL